MEKIKSSNQTIHKIKNINAHPASKVNCKCGSWLKHWQNYGGGNRPVFCIVCNPDCLEKATVGAHVQKPNDDKWYIAPLCVLHAADSEAVLTIAPTWPLVEADTETTCEAKKQRTYL
jgi:hypothetical protein